MCALDSVLFALLSCNIVNCRVLYSWLFFPSFHWYLPRHKPVKLSQNLKKKNLLDFFVPALSLQSVILNKSFILTTSIYNSPSVNFATYSNLHSVPITSQKCISVKSSVLIMLLQPVNWCHTLLSWTVSEDVQCSKERLSSHHGFATR